MSEPAIDLDEFDRGWDEEPEAERSGIRTRPQTTAPGKPPLPLHVVARRLVTALDVAAWAREELADRMGFRPARRGGAGRVGRGRVGAGQRGG